MKHLFTNTLTSFLALSLALLASCDKTTREESNPADESTIPAYTATLEQKIITAAAEACVEINDAIQKPGGIDILFAEEFSYEGKGYTSLTVPADAVKEAGESPDRKAFVFTFKNGEVVSLPYQGEVALAFPEEKDFTDFPLSAVEVPFMVTKAGHGELSVTVRSLAGHPAGNTEPEVEYIPAERKGMLRFTLPEQANTKISFTLTLTDGTNKADYTVTGSTYHFEWVGPKEVVIGGEQGSTAECAVSVKTDAPGITVNYECEGDFFSLDGETVMATGDNEADDERVGRIVFSESTGKFGTLEVAVYQDGMRPKAVEGCVPFNTWAFKRAAVAQADADGDGEVSLVEAHAVKELNLSNLGLETVEELRYFDRMEKLDLSNNKITRLDFSDVRSYAFLRDIDIRGNIVGTMDISGCWAGWYCDLKYDIKPTFIQNRPDYTSEDYEACEFEVIQTHTKGKGVILTFVTEDAIDLDYLSGAMQSRVNNVVTELFKKEPFKSLREYFDIYHSQGIEGNFAKSNRDGGTWLYEYALEIGSYEVAVFLTQDGFACPHAFVTPSIAHSDEFRFKNNGSAWPKASICLNRRRTVSMTGAPYSDNIDPDLLIHEIGHAMGGLVDQYMAVRANAPNCSKSGEPDEVPWKRFLSLPVYERRVGIYQKGEESYYPSMDSIMASQGIEGYYDSPSRYAIYHNIIQCANMDEKFYFQLPEETVWEEFLSYDVINNDIPE